MKSKPSLKKLEFITVLTIKELWLELPFRVGLQTNSRPHNQNFATLLDRLRNVVSVSVKWSQWSYISRNLGCG